MSTTNTYASTLPRQQQQSMRLLKDLQPLLLFNMFGARDTLDQRTGKKAVFRRFFNLPSPVAASGEGDRAVGQPLTFEDVTTNIVSFLSSVPLTKDQMLFSEDDLIAIAREKIPLQLAQTDDVFMFKQVRAGTQVRYAGGVAERGAVVSAPTRADFDLVVRDLEAANVPKVSKVVSASMNVATEPIRASYIAFCHPNLRGDITRTDGFIAAEHYAGQKLLHPEEMGATPSGIRFLPSTIIAPWLLAGASSSAAFLSGGVPVAAPAACDVYPIIIFGEEAWGHLDLKGYKSMEVSVIRPGSPQAKTVMDPTGETGVVAADLKTGGCILDERRIVRLECAANKTWS
jgi:N4-gp56 family major capsid protein